MRWVLLVFFLSSPAWALTQAIFPADGSKATIMLLSMTNADRDASDLFASLVVPDEVVEGKHTKKLVFDDAHGERVFSIICILSAFSTTNGTCTITVPTSNHAVIDGDSASVRVRIDQPDDIAQLVPNLLVPQTGPVFRSADGRLVLLVERASAGVSAFELNYR